MCEGCGEKQWITNHTYGSNGACTECGYVPCTVKATKTTLTVGMGETTVKVGYTKSGGMSTDKVTFKSSSTAVVKVNSTSGLLTPVKTGTATVTITYGTATAKVTVKVILPTVKLNKTKLTLARGMTSTLKATLSAKTNGANAVTWKSSNTKVVTVTSAGKLTAKAKGTATITVTTAGKKTATCKVTVVDPVPTLKQGSKALKNGATLTLKKGKSLTLGVALKPSATVTRTWTTSNKAVATVSSKGVVKGIKVGTATITLKLPSGRKAYVKIKVVK